MDGATASKNVLSPEAMKQALRGLVGAPYVRVADIYDAFAGVRPQVVVEPANESEIAAVLRWANENDLGVIPRGSGSKLSWGNPPRRADLILSVSRLNKILEHAWADLTVTAEAGCTVHALQQTLAHHGQRLALDPLWPERATVGGILSANDSGALRLRFGALRDLIIGVTLALPDGTLASSGGKVVKNVAGYDLPKLATGALGTLGIITRAVFRVHPLAQASKTYSCIVRDTKELQAVILAVHHSNLAHSALQARCVPGTTPQVDILLEGTERGIASQAAQLKALGPLSTLIESDPIVWNARQDVYSSAGAGESAFVVAKTSVLPDEIGKTIETVIGVAATLADYRAVFQATGIGVVLLRGEASRLANTIESLRRGLERGGGSLVIHGWGGDVAGTEAWGDAGDAMPLMRSVKRQFDPKSTLNPGRFVGGI